jgi:hypothetical protein
LAVSQSHDLIESRMYRDVVVMGIGVAEGAALAESQEERRQEGSEG